MEGAINPHRLKDDETYFRVAAMYDSNGLKSNYNRALFKGIDLSGLHAPPFRREER
jgi:hypothetical protein